MNDERLYHPEIMAAIYNDKPFWYQGHWFRAIELLGTLEDPCDLCDVPSACNPDLASLCSEIDSYWGGQWLLKLLA